MFDDEASNSYDDATVSDSLEDMKGVEIPHDECATKHEDMTVPLASQKKSDDMLVKNQQGTNDKRKNEDYSLKETMKSTKKKKQNDLDLTNEQKHDQKLNDNDKKKKNQEMEKIRPSEEITCMNDREHKPENCPHCENHTQKTDLDMLEKEDDASYLFGNCYAFDASC